MFGNTRIIDWEGFIREVADANNMDLDAFKNTFEY